MSSTAPRGEDHHLTPFTAANVRRIVLDYQGGASAGAIARRCGVSVTTVTRILKGHTWRTVTGGVSVYQPRAAQLAARRREAVIRLRAGCLTQTAIADELGISQSTVSTILTDRRSADTGT